MKTYLKIIFLILIFSAFVFGLSAEEYIENKTQVIVTKYFDIIYPKESTQTAVILAENVDELYLKACALLESEPYFRIPVSIVSTIDVLNAYFSFFPYNHIVLYDTVSDESLAVFSETILSVFYHELVHAVSLQKKSKAWQIAGNIFGDILSPAPIFYTPLSFVEGVTVSLESYEGEGRLNDAFSTQIIRQAKIEGKFPNWQQASQVRDIYPVGSVPYLFGGAFSSYLQKTYGMEKYAQFWEACGKLHFMGSLESIILSIYGKDLKELWSAFKDSIIILDEENIIDPRKQKNITALETKKSLFQFLTQSKKGYAWFDLSSKEIWYESYETGKRKKLFTTSNGQQNISLSLDGNYFVSSYVLSYPLGRNYTSVYDLETKKKLQSIDALRDACLVKLSDEKEYIAGVKTKGQKTSIELWAFLTNAKEASIQKTFSINAIPFSLSPLDDGRLAYILKENNNWSIVLWNPLDNVEEKFVFQTGQEPIRYLNPVFESKSLIGLSFSFAEKAFLPKMVFFDFASKTFFIQSQEISGGIYYPLLKDGAVIFVSQFFEHDSLFVSPLDSIFQNAEVLEASFTNKEKNNELGYVENNVDKYVENYIGESFSFNDLGNQEKLLEEYKIKKYNPLAYMTKGVFFPVIEMDASDDPNLGNDIELTSFSTGLSWLTGDPLDKWQILIQASYDFIKDQVKLNTSIENTDFGFPIILDAQTIFGFDGYFLHQYKLSPSIQISLGNSPYYFHFDSIINFLQFRENAENPFLSFFDFGNMLSFSSLRKVNLNYFANKGFNIGFEYWLHNKNSAKILSSSIFTYNIFASIAFPQLLPFENALHFTYNLPTVFEASLFSPENFYAKENALWSARVKSTLFAYDLQNGFSTFYVQRLGIEADYSFGQKIDTIDYENPIKNFENYNFSDFSDSIGIGAYFTFSTIIGQAITQLKIDLGGQYRYYIREEKNTWKLLFRFAL